MKVLLIYPNKIESPKDVSQGLAQICAMLKKEHHEVALLDSTFGLEDEAITKKVGEFRPDLVAMTVASNDYHYAKHIAELIKKIEDIPILAGGFHPTIAPYDFIKETCFDMVCIGEGEEAILELLYYMNRGNINYNLKNIWFKRGEEVITNPLRKLNENLDILPYPDREIFNYQKYIDWNRGLATFISTRGCPFECSYCINKTLIDRYGGLGKYVRFKSIDYLFGEIKDVLKKYKVNEIEFYDDTFTLDMKRLREFCRRYPNEIKLPFYLNVRVNAATKEMFEMLKRAGCTRVNIGLESGDPVIRNQILKRNMTDQQIIDTFRWAKEAGLETYAFNMIGIPYETAESIEKTLELNRKIQPDRIGVSIFNAYKGTELYKLCKDNGWLTEEIVQGSYFQTSNVKHPNFTVAQLKIIRDTFGAKVYGKDRKIRALLDIIDKKLVKYRFFAWIRSQLFKTKFIKKVVNSV
jgi:anaerobic magnesium-protoporphyrin IX monomethyl ester cyclase